MEEQAGALKRLQEALGCVFSMRKTISKPPSRIAGKRANHCEEFDQPALITYKGEVDLVTQADKRSEETIVARLAKYFPEHSIAAEEAAMKAARISLARGPARWHDKFRPRPILAFPFR